ncbi:hypothetical protein [Desulforhopalus singaporensis]|uniref:Conjugal transfer protein TraB n=1 Tax=Desulforhopalus singaporensis TaxID=91360 RepID=A0A1H0P416_9BACT|nr:hypothetical protein [Desulforhopalus singaporensis]SDO99425.1 hypothetical protein SAMN05660330_01560 [Desulforhopalus singaporensis]
MNDARNNTSKNIEKSDVSNETILKFAKEITVKFIEVGRVTPATFAHTFDNIYTTIANSVRNR